MRDAGTSEMKSISGHIWLYLLSKFKLIVALLSPSSFFAVTLYLPASSTVTFFISSDAKYECPSLSIINYMGHVAFCGYKKKKKYLYNDIIGRCEISLFGSIYLWIFDPCFGFSFDIYDLSNWMEIFLMHSLMAH